LLKKCSYHTEGVSQECFYTGREGETMLSGVSNTEGLKEGIAEMLDNYSKIYSEPPPEGQPPSYIHLKDARIFAPGQNPIPSSGLLWRGRISCVEGFSMGSFSPA
jgi:hypothetical protein